METVTLTIDGQAVTVDKGKTVLQAAIEHGVSVPYYCYHPGIGIDGSCRVCIVKIEKMPKLQTSCSTVCTDGMVVNTRTQEVIEARAGVFEFLLINHPLDCPVCDKGGECPLQDFSYTFGRDQSRMEFPRRVFDGEGVRGDVDFGPTLMLNRNRCILCTRCSRFMREVDGDAQINVIDRGNGSEIATFQEEGVHSILSGNLMDVCPVGAITTRDYRFKSRPWDNPNAVDTICTRCEKGCNTTAWRKANADGVRFLLSAHASHEELFLFRRLAEELIGHAKGVTATWTSSAKPQPDNTKFVVPETDAPNVAGVRAFGLGDDVSALRAEVEGGRVTALYVYDPGPATIGDVQWI